MKLATIVSTASAAVLYTIACQAGEPLRSCNTDEHIAYWVYASASKNSDPEIAEAARQQMDTITSQCSIFSTSVLRSQQRDHGY